MMFSPARALALTAIAALLAVVPCTAQSTPATPPAQQGTPAPNTQSGQPPEPQGQVIFSRSVDADGTTTTKAGAATAKPSIQMVDAPLVEDADRQAITFTDFDMDVRLHPAARQVVIRALVTVRNTGKTALPRIPLQISSSLNWERIRVAGKDISFAVATLNSDADHTGQLHEAAVPLAQPLAPGATIQLDVTYSGEITSSAKRLVALGAPEGTAHHSDWDEISVPFTGLRGFGNVVWYPVSSIPVILGDGARLFDEVGTQKLRISGARFRLRLTDEFPHGDAPTIALVNGNPLPLTISDPSTTASDVSSIATGSTETSTLTFESPSLFVAEQTAHPGPHLTAYTTPENNTAVNAWLTAASSVAPFVERWLGPKPATQLTLLDLPDPDDAPWETGPLLVIGLRDAAPEDLSGLLAHALTHAWMNPSSAWLDEGVANFMGTLWTERRRGRDQAIASLEAGRPALALAEPPSPAEGAGQPMAQAIAPVYYRTKATYILWGLRDALGDDALSAALRAYNGDDSNAPAGDPGNSHPLSFQAALKQASPHTDLSWLFSDWIDNDKGLPDLTIDKVYPNAVQSGNWLVSVTVSNAGYATADVPLTVRSAANITADRILVPARGNATLRVLIQGKPSEVQVNDGTVPETQASAHQMNLDQPTPPPTATPPPN
jgi:hypothetical protein